ncbi:MAG: bacteriophage abortive infection AbiH family protein [Clostridia bacterium]|nr:bacteriophage abortive infection AbiH family protein [Clostridia bacterium]
MTITFLLGNGFDLNLGLKTQYKHFYEYYLSLDKTNDTPVIEAFKKDLADNLENWSDLEIVLGKYAEKFNNETENDFIELLYNIQDALADYLDKQDSTFTISDEDKKKAISDLILPENYLTLREKQDFLEYKKQINTNSYALNVISFNYTKTFENIFGWNGKPLTIGSRRAGNTVFNDEIKLFEHIHGTTDDNMILGVNDSTQINNEKLKIATKTIRALIKTEMNLHAGTLRDNRCVSAIQNADLICIYGMSLGETDKFWWEKICSRLANSHARLIIFSKANEVPSRRKYMASNNKDELKNKLVAHFNYDIQIKKRILNQTFVCLNSNMFKVKLNYPEKKSDIAIAFDAVEKLNESAQKSIKIASSQ